MRITFVLAAFDLAGGERVAAIYATELRRRGHEVFAIACPPFAPTWRQRLRALVTGEKLIEGRYKASHFAETDVPHAMTDRRRPIGDDDVPDADVIVATWWETAHWIDAMSPVKGAKVHFIQHYEAFTPEFSEGVDSAWRLAMPKITIAKWLTRLAKQRFGRTDVTEIYNSVDTDQFQAPPRRRNAAPTVGMLYSPVVWKGVGVGFAAFERLRLKFPDARLVTFGAEDPGPELPLPANASHVRLPAQDSIRDIYAQCDVWLCASTAEGFHLPPLEAMACRCPVVSTRVGGPEDIIVDGVNGYLCPVGDDAALADRMIEVLAQPEADWQRMSDAALATATRYSWKDATDLFEAALCNVVERQSAGRG